MDANKSISKEEKALKWPEIISLAGLNAAVVISWIAYHEYQPVLMERFEFEGLLDFLIISKAIILVIIPPIAGLLADFLLKKNGKYFIIFTIGIGATAMVFMAVATVIGSSHLLDIKGVLPFMLVFWLIAMNLFISPANSMIDSFAPAQKLPIVVGFLFLITELIYSLEPMIVELVKNFGDTLTFIIGGILIAGTGYLFQRTASNEVILRKSEMIKEKVGTTQIISFVAVIAVGIMLGLGKAFLIEFFPHIMENRFLDSPYNPSLIASALLAFAALFAYWFSRYVNSLGTHKVIPVGFLILTVGVLILIFTTNYYFFITGGIVTAISFGVLNISGLPYTFQHISVRHITYGVGVFIGASEIFTGIFEIYLE